MQTFVKSRVLEGDPEIVEMLEGTSVPFKVARDEVLVRFKVQRHFRPPRLLAVSQFDSAISDCFVLGEVRSPRDVGSVFFHHCNVKVLRLIRQSGDELQTHVSVEAKVSRMLPPCGFMGFVFLRTPEDIP